MIMAPTGTEERRWRAGPKGAIRCDSAEPQVVEIMNYENRESGSELGLSVVPLK